MAAEAAGRTPAPALDVAAHVTATNDPGTGIARPSQLAEGMTPLLVVSFGEEPRVYTPHCGAGFLMRLEPPSLEPDTPAE